MGGRLGILLFSLRRVGQKVSHMLIYPTARRIDSEGRHILSCSGARRVGYKVSHMLIYPTARRIDSESRHILSCSGVWRVG